MSAQISLFDFPPIGITSNTTAASSGILGLTVVLPMPCRACGSLTAVIGSSAGPHHARLDCSNCNRHSGWMSGAGFKFLAETVEYFGRPDEPIIIHQKAGDCEHDHQRNIREIRRPRPPRHNATTPIHKERATLWSANGRATPDHADLEQRLYAELGSAPDREAARIALDNAAWWLMRESAETRERVYETAEDIIAEISK